VNATTSFMYITVLHFSNDLNKTELVMYITLPHFISALNKTELFVNIVEAVTVITHAVISDPSG
jgi:hypothetical protein